MTTARAEPTLSRRHAAGSETVRGLLITVLGELVLPTGGSAWTSAFLDLLDRLGVEEKAGRQALMRMAADGWLTGERHGRRTLWRLAPSAEQLLTEGTERIYGFRGVTRDWDGQFVLVLARVPETDRSARHLLRTRLSWIGFGTPAPGLWISPHSGRVAEVERVLAEASFDEARVFLARYHGGGDLPGMIRQAWHVDAIQSRYSRFLADFAGPVAADPLARVVELVHAWRRFPSIDPELPSELLPPLWSGERAADLFAERQASWSAGARRGWLALNEVDVGRGAG
jgi:phenylacetic acid degradation operon negative regulatory protein